MADQTGRTFVLDGVNQQRRRGDDGADRVTGTAARPWVWNGRRGVIQLRGGADRIGPARFVRLEGETALGRGADRVRARDSITLLAVDAFNGTLRLGAGSDEVRVRRGGFTVGEDSVVDLGGGDDRIEAAAAALVGGVVQAGRGADRLELGEGRLVISLGLLSMGDGRDRLIAPAGLRVSDGSCAMGGGDDRVDVRAGGLNHWDAPSNLLDLGGGDDRLIGFASRPVPGAGSVPGGGLRGGRGFDTLVLTPGVYTVRHDAISNGEALLPVRGINGLEGLNGGRFRLQPGILTVNPAGVAAFVPEL